MNQRPTTHVQVLRGGLVNRSKSLEIFTLMWTKRVLFKDLSCVELAVGPLWPNFLAKREVTVIQRDVNFCSRIECARTIPEMYSGFGARMRSSQMDVDGAFAKFGQKKPGEIQWNTNHCLTFVLIVENSKTMLGCSQKWKIQSAHVSSPVQWMQANADDAWTSTGM